MKFQFRGAAMVLVFLGLTMAFVMKLDSMRKNARRISCQSQLKMLGLAINQYVRDYDENYPLATNWNEALIPYAKANLHCPQKKIGYNYNRYLEGFWIEGTIIERVGERWSSSNAAMVYEAPGTFGADGGERWPLGGVHGEGVNVCFVDGHVEWVKSKPKFFESNWASLKRQRVAYQKREAQKRATILKKRIRKSGQKSRKKP